MERNERQPGKAQARSIPEHPAMLKHPEPVDLDEKIDQPFMPRANLAISIEKPDGSLDPDNWRDSHKKYSTLQQHCLFFDRDGDGVIWPQDTFWSFFQLGYNLLICVVAVAVIHGGFSYPTSSSWIPDPFFRVHQKRMHRAKHGSDTGTYDTEGRFIPHKFEEIFSKYDKDRKGGLTYKEGINMIQSNRMVMDPFGWTGAFFEWSATYLLIWPQDGVVRREDLRQVYDGSIFFRIAEQQKSQPRRGLSGFLQRQKVE